MTPMETEAWPFPATWGRREGGREGEREGGWKMGETWRSGSGLYPSLSLNMTLKKKEGSKGGREGKRDLRRTWIST